MNKKREISADVFILTGEWIDYNGRNILKLIGTSDEIGPVEICGSFNGCSRRSFYQHFVQRRRQLHRVQGRVAGIHAPRRVRARHSPHPRERRLSRPHAHAYDRAQSQCRPKEGRRGDHSARPLGEAGGCGERDRVPGRRRRRHVHGHVDRRRRRRAGFERQPL